VWRGLCLRVVWACPCTAPGRGACSQRGLHAPGTAAEKRSVFTNVLHAGSPQALQKARLRTCEHAATRGLLGMAVALNVAARLTTCCISRPHAPHAAAADAARRLRRGGAGSMPPRTVDIHPLCAATAASQAHNAVRGKRWPRQQGGQCAVKPHPCIVGMLRRLQACRPSRSRAAPSWSYTGRRPRCTSRCRRGR
jgi:hypothetical protein